MWQRNARYTKKTLQVEMLTETIHMLTLFTGISVGCHDTYQTGLDCQWVDVTTLPPNRTYILRVALNPDYMIGEMSFENNGAECLLHYTGERATTRLTRCASSPLWYGK